MDKITYDVHHQQWLDIIHACNASALQERPGVNRTASKLNLFITGSNSCAAKRMMRRCRLPVAPEVSFSEVAAAAS